MVTIKEWCAANDMTEHRFAKKARVPTSSLSRFLTGQSSLSAENMLRVVSFTKGAVTLESLIGQGARVLRKKQRARKPDEDGAAL